MQCDDYLIYGVTGLTRAVEQGWVAGHYGAAVLAAYYFCRENALDRDTETAIRKQVDAMMARHPELFRPVPYGPSDDRLLDQIPRALEANIGGLREQGHNVIYAMFAIRALKQAPDLIAPEVVSPICRLIRLFDGRVTTRIARAGTRPGVDVTGIQVRPEDGIPAYTSEEAIISTALEEVGSLERAYYPGVRGEAGHLVTHAHALVELARLGYADLARKGHAAHRLQVRHLRLLRRFGADDVKPDDPAGANPLSARYWEGDLERKDWLAGHAFKYGYQFLDLLKKVEDPRARATTMRQLGYILMHAGA